MKEGGGVGNLRGALRCISDDMRVDLLAVDDGSRVRSDDLARNELAAREQTESRIGPEARWLDYNAAIA